MKVIIAGSRDIVDYNEIVKAITASEFIIDEIISGAARGVDRLGERYAKEHDITLNRKPANWDRYGKSAGYRRNEEMAQDADALIAIWDGKSKGTNHMINLAQQYNLRIFIHQV